MRYIWFNTKLTPFTGGHYEYNHFHGTNGVLRNSPDRQTYGSGTHTAGVELGMSYTSTNGLLGGELMMQGNFAEQKSYGPSNQNRGIRAWFYVSLGYRISFYF